MRHKFLPIAVAAMVVFSFSMGPQAFAEEGKSKWNPAGWMKGEKKGWKEGDVPPGLSGKDARKAEKEARKKARRAEKEARKNEKKAEREARAKAKELLASAN